VEKDHKMLISCEDGNIHEMAMGAAERALSTIRTTISGDPNANEGKHFYLKGGRFMDILVSV
jgi:hypothetical protein